MFTLSSNSSWYNFYIGTLLNVCHFSFIDNDYDDNFSGDDDDDDNENQFVGNDKDDVNNGDYNGCLWWC